MKMNKIRLILGFLTLWLPFAAATAETFRFAGREYKVDTVEITVSSGEVLALRICNTKDRILGTPDEIKRPAEPPKSFVEYDETRGEFVICEYLPQDWRAFEMLCPKMSPHDLAELIDPCFSLEEKYLFSEKNAEVIVRVLVDDAGAVVEVRQYIMLHGEQYSGRPSIPERRWVRGWGFLEWEKTMKPNEILQGELYSGSLVPFLRIDQMLRTHLSYEDLGRFKRGNVPWGATNLWLYFPEGEPAARIHCHGNIKSSHL